MDINNKQDGQDGVDTNTNHVLVQSPYTPYYCIDEDMLLNDVELLRTSLNNHWGKGNYICGYSVKTNSLPWLLRYLKKHGFYAEVVSETEVDLANRLGYDFKHMVYNGPIKAEETFCNILLSGGYINMDSNDELGYLERLSRNYLDKTFEIGIRINFDMLSQCGGDPLTGQAGGRFGYCYENGVLSEVICRINKLSNVRLAGLHMHTSSATRTLDIYKNLATFAIRLTDEFRLDISYIDIGGGFFGGLPNRPSYPDYFEVICRELRRRFDPDKVTLIVEPGVSLISSASTFVTSIHDIKDIRGQRYLITDGSRLNLNPQVNRHNYLHHLDRLNEVIDYNKMSSQWVVGYTCMEYDRIFDIIDEMPLSVGDRIIYDNAGGYTMCLTPLFIRYLPPIYIHKGDGTYYTAREQWGVDEYLQGHYWD